MHAPVKRRGAEAALAAWDVDHLPSESAAAKLWRAWVTVRLRTAAPWLLAIVLLLLTGCVQLYMYRADAPTHGMQPPSSSTWPRGRSPSHHSPANTSTSQRSREVGTARLHPPSSQHRGGTVHGRGAGEGSGAAKAGDAQQGEGVAAGRDHLANDVDRGHDVHGWHSLHRARVYHPIHFSTPPEESREPTAAAEEESGDGGGGAEKGKAPKPEHHRKSPVGRVSGMGTGASKNLRELSERAAAAALKGRIGKSGEPVLFGDINERSFVLNRARWREGDELPFPRKKLRFQLTHYTLGKVTKPLLDVLPAADPVRASLAEGKHETCAVVGNGGSLLLYRLGAAVDAHDVVIRLNGGPTKSFEQHVGRKTTFRMTNRNHMGFSESPREAVLQHVSTPDALEHFVAVARQAQQNGHAPVYALDPEFHEYSMSFMDKGVLSNGFYGVLLATALCHRVTVYGFLHQWKGSAKYHYYDDVQPDGQQSLRDAKEANRFAWFLGNRSATHGYGEPCMQGPECVACPAGATCQAGVWHPVPEPGRCFFPQHPRGAGVPDVRCFPRCESCLGGVLGECPPSVPRHTRCTDGGFVQA